MKRQREAWVERIDIQELIPNPKMKHVNSLLDRGAVDQIAAELMRWKQGVQPYGNFLGPRVLFACTLANLNGIPVDGRERLARAPPSSTPSRRRYTRTSGSSTSVSIPTTPRRTRTAGSCGRT